LRFRDKLLMRAFGRPEGLLGWIGGRLMVRGKTECGRWLAARLALADDASILEVGCGPGVVLGVLAEVVPRGRVVGVEPSPVMLRQARRRNGEAIRAGRVELLGGEAEAIPAADASFDVVVALNSVQLWHDRLTGFRECRRVLRRAGVLCIGFTPEAGRPPEEWEEGLCDAGLGRIESVQGAGAAWTLARVP
jgi:ubiquinone/menaquinone biosynthesis C-methylase UbiE